MRTKWLISSGFRAQVQTKARKGVGKQRDDVLLHTIVSVNVPLACDLVFFLLYPCLRMQLLFMLIAGSLLGMP
jgi:hypothetical protein